MLPAAAGSLLLTRDPGHGLVTRIDQSSLRETLTYNCFGELATQVSTFGTTPLSSLTYHTTTNPRDNLGRVVQKVEVISGTTYTWRYGYDALNRLTDVFLGGVLVEHFEYDDNGNRTSYWSPSTGTIDATYDEQDRLLTYGEWEFTYGANGELETKTSTVTGDAWLFQYDVLGNLLTVGLPDGRLVEYLVDGLGRRVGKKVDGVLVQQWLYRDQLKPVAELDGLGNLTKQFVYGSRANVPDFVVVGSSKYRVLSDQLGSPRLVVDTATGAVVQRMRHDAFGVVLEDTNPGVTPFGFAGGVYDVDTGLVRFGARDYDPSVGRWVSKDPIQFSSNGSNIYEYCRDDPTNLIDENGLEPKPGITWTLPLNTDLTPGKAGLPKPTNLPEPPSGPPPPSAQPPGRPGDAPPPRLPEIPKPNGSPASSLPVEPSRFLLRSCPRT